MYRMCLVVIQLKFALILRHQRRTTLSQPQAKPDIDDIAVIHIGTTIDLQNTCNIVKKAKKLASPIKEVDKDHYERIALSNIINREDKDFKNKINNANKKLKNYCNSAGMKFIDNLNIGGSCLNRVKLHMNSKDTAASAKTLCRFVKFLS